MVLIDYLKELKVSMFRPYQAARDGGQIGYGLTQRRYEPDIFLCWLN